MSFTLLSGSGPSGATPSMGGMSAWESAVPRLAPVPPVSEPTVPVACKYKCKYVSSCKIFYINVIISNGMRINNPNVSISPV